MKTLRLFELLKTNIKVTAELNFGAEEKAIDLRSLELTEVYYEANTGKEITLKVLETSNYSHIKVEVNGESDLYHYSELEFETQAAITIYLEQNCGLINKY